MLYILPYPWSVFAPEGYGALVSFDGYQTFPVFDAETISFLWPACGDPLRICDRTAFVSARPITTKVLRSGEPAHSQNGAQLMAPALPSAAPLVWHLFFKGRECEINVSGQLRRSSRQAKAEGESSRREGLLRNTVEVLTGYFRAAHDLHPGSDRRFDESGSAAGIRRREWRSIWRLWREMSSGAEPPMARIVEIARDHALRLRDVCERPRRMLIRDRSLTPVARVQELDAECIRYLSRQPGRTIVERAGQQQKIMALVRRETTDTAENRVMRDFLRLCRSRAADYLRDFRNAAGHARVDAVRRLQRLCFQLDASSPIADAGLLVGLPRPNYVLQHDQRYHPLWAQYERLRREEQAIDDAWSWSRILWADFVRGLLVAWLHSEDRLDSGGWHPHTPVAAYVRGEQAQGQFFPPISISLRLTRDNNCDDLLVVHPGHSHLCPVLQNLLPKLGADLMLVLRRGPDKTPIAVWCIYAVMSLGSVREKRRQALRSLSKTFARLENAHKPIRFSALLVRCRLRTGAESVQHRRVAHVAADARAGFWFHDFPQFLSEFLEESSR